MSWVYLMIAIVSEVIATSTLKATAGFTRLIPSVIVVLGYGASFYFLSLTLDEIPVGISYAIWSGIGIVLIAVIGLVVYKQALSIPEIIGLVLIGVGIVVINLSSSSTAH
ncbi:MAG: multidrug efflux SMR transporter [Chloroflexi bacterium]|nr:multidrug efflux SMR transporter [Chloroflexota bacterium]